MAAELLPFDFRTVAKKINGYAKELMEMTNDLRESTVIENKLISEKYYSLAADPTKTFVTPKPKDEVPFLNFSALQNALTALEKSSGNLAMALNNPALSSDQKNKINIQLYQAEQQLLLKDGLPRRGWYRHSIYAPGFYTGYGVKTLPGIREAIEQRNWKEAQEQIELVAQSITRFSDYISNIGK